MASIFQVVLCPSDSNVEYLQYAWIVSGIAHLVSSVISSESNVNFAGGMMMLWSYFQVPCKSIPSIIFTCSQCTFQSDGLVHYPTVIFSQFVCVDLCVPMYSRMCPAANAHIWESDPLQYCIQWAQYCIIIITITMKPTTITIKEQ